MRAIQSHTILLLFLLISHAGISSTRSYIRNEFKNYNYLDSGEYYLDSNFNFGYLFPNDTIAKDLEIKFVKNKILHIVGESYFNVCKVKNKSDKILDLDFKINLPAGWKLLNSSVLFSRSIIPGGEINLPLRLTIPENVMGGIAYVVNLVASTKEKEFFGATYIKLPEISDWNFEITKNKIYFNELYNTEKLTVYLSNKGNTIENIKLNFKIGNKLNFIDSIGYNNVYVSIPPYSDTILSYQVQRSNVPKEIGLYTNSWNENEILVTATGRDGKIKRRNFSFFDLDNKYYNIRNESCSPLNLGLSVFNLASGFAPSTNFNAYGEVQLNQSHQFNYSLNMLNLSFQNGFNLRNYLNNPFLYSFSASHNWDDKLRTNIGNISGSGALFGQNGRGFESSYKLKNSSVGASIVSNMFIQSWTASAYYGSSILIPIISKSISYKFSLYYQDNSTLGLRSISPQLSLSFAPIKNQSINLSVLPSFANYDSTLGNLPNQDSSINGASYRISYAGSYKNITVRVSNVNTKNSLLIANGMTTTSSDVRYKINNMSNFSYTSFISNQSPSKLFSILNQSGQFAGWNNHRLVYNNRVNKKVMFSCGPNIQTTTRQEFINPNTPNASFSNQTFGLVGTMSYRINKLETVTPNVFFGRTRFYDNVVNSTNNNLASNVSFGINYRRPFWGINFRYNRGTTFFLDQSAFQIPDFRVSNETIFVRANFNKEIPAKNLSFQGFVNYFYRMPSNAQNVGLSGKIDFQIIKRLNGYANANLFSNSLSNSEDGASSARFFSLSFGLLYNVDIPQPKIKYHNLKVICFEDLNGDNVKNENERAIPNIILKISRDFESDFLNTPFSEKELISDFEGSIVLNDLPEGDFFLSFRSLENLKVLYNIKGNDEEISLEEDHTLFVPYGEGYKVTGQIKISRDVNSSRGTIKSNNIRVQAVSNSGEVFSTLTDANGYYSISVPYKGYFRVSMKNIFGDDFYIKNNKTLIQFDGFKLFKVDLDVIEKSRSLKINGNSKFNFGNQ